MNSSIDYTARAETIRGVLAMRPASQSLRGIVQAAQLRMLDRIETGLAESLVRGGVSKDAAAHSAFLFVRGCVQGMRDAGSAAVR